jgi:hypothetical protein
LLSQRAPLRILAMVHTVTPFSDKISPLARLIDDTTHDMYHDCNAKKKFLPLF